MIEDDQDEPTSKDGTVEESVLDGSSGAEEAASAAISATGLDGSSGAEEAASAAISATGLEGSSGAEETVDELEDRVRDLQGAMEKIQSGDLDAAERAIEALEQRMTSTRD